MPTFYFNHVENFSILVHSKSPPDDESWNAYTTYLHTLDASPNTLVVTEGGAPNKKQRQQLNNVFKDTDKKVKTAVLTDKLMPRMAIHAIAILFSPGIRSFKPIQFKEAMNYIEAPPRLHEKMEEMVQALQNKLKNDG